MTPAVQLRSEGAGHLLVTEIINQHAERTPQAIAVACGLQQLTYGELHLQSQRVAARLKRKGIGPGQLVAVYIERSIELPALLLGILQAGAAYLPIDPAIPEKRLHFMLADSQASLVVVHPDLLARVGAHRSCLVSDLLADREPDIAAGHDSGATQFSGNDLAYVIYTSGSTGRPKGVEISHRALAICLEAVRAELAVTPDDAVLSVTSPSFDVSVEEMLVALTSGAELVLLPQGKAIQSEYLREALENNNVGVMFGTPALWRLLIESGWRGNSNLRAVVGGEQLEPALARELVERTAAVWNHYGPTETTIVATTYRVGLDRFPVPIGAPLPHIRAYVVDGEDKLVKPGETGELLIGGETLATGYRNRPDLTASKFVVLELEDGREERVYRSGDLVRLQSDGVLEFVGRIDNQVKIRGFRIELEEIETVLSEHPAVAECAVVAHEDAAHEKNLVAYYRPRSQGESSAEILRSFLLSRLPAYMAPSHFVEILRFPLTVNGKIDRLDLSRRPIEVSEIPDATAHASDPVVAELLSIWRRVLKTSQVQVTDNFFEIGGHSVLAARMFNEIAVRLGKKLPLATLFEAPTVESLARVIAQAEPVPWSPLVSIRTTGTGTPFFCVHPIGGNVLIFKHLSEAMGTRPFYGLQARGLDGQETAHTSVEAMASDYLSYVREVQPSGPYLLGGYSAGGLVAFEMARLLRAQGEDVDLVVLLDTYLHAYSVPSLPGTAQQRSAVVKPLLGVARRLNQMRSLPKGQRFGVLKRDAERFWATVKLTAYGSLKGVGVLPFHLDAVSAFLLALRNYRPKPQHLNVLLFLADVNAPPSSAMLPSLWRNLVLGKLEVRHVAIDHDRLLDPPLAGKLAGEIEQAISKSSATMEGRLRW